jgi:hypothetical protein
VRGKVKRLLLSLIHPSWGARKPVADGYTFVIPAPMDMPFLTYLALEGLRALDLTHCREVLVVPDGCATDGGRALAEAIRASGFPGVKLLGVPRRNRLTLSLFGHGGIAHWMTIVGALREAGTDLIYLHDSDAFFTGKDLVESNYRMCRDQQLVSLGVTTRWDPKFQELQIEIPGTWELMFSAAWARKWTPVDHKAGQHDTPIGPVFFDTMLYPQYRDYGSGLIRVVDSDAFVHLSGTVVTYRKFLDFAERNVGDELFRLLFLSLLNELSPQIESECKLPSVEELALGLRDPTRRVHYCFPDAVRNYKDFSATIVKLVATPLFAPHEQEIARLLAPFDRQLSKQEDVAETAQPRIRSHGLWLG